MTLRRGSNIASVGILVACHALAQCGEWTRGMGGIGTNALVSSATLWNSPEGPQVVIAGDFTRAGSALANRFARYVEGDWEPMGAVQFVPVGDIAALDLGAGPELLTAATTGSGGADIYRWNGTDWQLRTIVPTSQSITTELVAFDSGSGPLLHCLQGGAVLRHDGSQWTFLTTTAARAGFLCVWDDGTGPALYAAGSLGQYGTGGSTRFARWNGSAWTALPFPATNNISELAEIPTPAGSRLAAAVASGPVALWDGVQWTLLPGISTGAIRRIFPSTPALGGFLGICGSFQFPGGATLGLAAWNGTSWSWPQPPPGLDFPGMTVNAVVERGGTLFIGGEFGPGAPTTFRNIAAYNGTWFNTGGGQGLGAGQATAVASWDLGNGPELYVSGFFTTAGDVPATAIARWNGSSWSALGAGLQFNTIPFGARALAAGGVPMVGERLVAAGGFNRAGGQPISTIAAWDGSGWSSVGSGLGGSATCLVFDPSPPAGRLYVGGSLSVAGSAASSRVACYDGSSWVALAPLGPVLRSLAIFDDGSGAGPQLYAAGALQLGAGSTGNVARWDGTNWTPAGSGPDGEVYALAEHADSSGSALFAGGNFQLPGPRLARWTGQAWTPVANTFSLPVTGLASHTDAEGPALVAAGSFTFVGANGPASGVGVLRGGQWFGLDYGIVRQGGFSVAGVSSSSERATGVTQLAFAGDFDTVGTRRVINLAIWRACPFDSYCEGDGLDLAVVACPCGNSGSPGAGCASGPTNTGGKMSLTGVAAVANDQLALRAEGLSGRIAVFLQSTSANAGGAGTPFGDGISCLGGSLIRLGSRPTQGGVAELGFGHAGDPLVSVRGLVPAEGGHRHYQVLYRSAFNYCTPATFALTNGMRCMWVP